MNYQLPLQAAEFRHAAYKVYKFILAYPYLIAGQLYIEVTLYRYVNTVLVLAAWSIVISWLPSYT